MNGLQCAHEKNDFITKLSGRRIRVEELKQELVELIQSIGDVRILLKIRSFLLAINERIAQRV